MKNSIIGAIVIFSALLGGCSKHEEGLNASLSPIVFERPVSLATSNTRLAVGEISKKYPKCESFVVYAVTTSADFIAWNDPDASLFMNSVRTEYDASLNGWVPFPDFYWPKGRKVTFAAYSPEDLLAHVPDQNSVSYAQAGLVIDNYTTPANGFEKSTNPNKTKDKITAYDPVERLTMQYDMLYSERSYNRESGGVSQNKPYNGVDLVFHHAMTSVCMTLEVKSTVASKYLLKNVRLAGIAHRGKFEECVAEQVVKGELVYKSSPRWTLKQDPATNLPYVTDYDAFDMQTVVQNDTPKEIPTELYGAGFKFDYTYPLTELPGNGKGRQFILMPQQIPQDAEIRLELMMLLPEGDPNNENDFIEQHVSVKLKDLTPEGQWKIGYKYTYNIVIDPMKIAFNPTVDVWDPKDGGEIIPD